MGGLDGGLGGGWDRGGRRREGRSVVTQHMWRRVTCAVTWHAPWRKTFHARHRKRGSSRGLRPGLLSGPRAARSVQTPGPAQRREWAHLGASRRAARLARGRLVCRLLLGRRVAARSAAAAAAAGAGAAGAEGEPPDAGCGLRSRRRCGAGRGRRWAAGAAAGPSGRCCGWARGTPRRLLRSRARARVGRALKAAARGCWPSCLADRVHSTGGRRARRADCCGALAGCRRCGTQPCCSPPPPAAPCAAVLPRLSCGAISVLTTAFAAGVGPSWPLGPACCCAAGL
jgi:hypothetical protein